MKKVPEQLLKPYEAKQVEASLYKAWEESGYFNPDNLPKVNGKERTEPYTIILPPPNVTGILHAGHALMLTIEDVLIRHKRMRGYKTLWLPGTDHAAIATQSKVEKDIYKKEGKSRHDLGREEMLKRIAQFAKESHDTITNQCRAMGSSLDWSREAFTLDDKRNLAVRTAFKQMYDDGLIYRGYRIVNWDPKGQTTISDDEIVNEEKEGTMYTFKYSHDFPIAISSTRPETKVGDTAVAVHPEDARYKEYIGKTYECDFAGAKISIRVVADEYVDKDFGTGALGVTPAHSQADWDIKERHHLPIKIVINEYAKMTEEAGTLLSGKKVGEARTTVVEWLKENNLLINEEKLTQSIPTAERTSGVIEPLPKLQWFVAVNKKFNHFGKETTLKELMHHAVAGGDITILPDRFDKVYHHWIDGLRDWCISRQIWYGHRIPVWYKRGNLAEQTQKNAEKIQEEIYCGINKPDGDGWIQDEDTLDTWFSSGLWTFSTLGWPEKTKDLKFFHPTDVLETGYDILFFWVARMILFSTYLLNEPPFKTIYLHGLVRDGQGRKMSKSLGNIIDPLEMIEKYGTDALRMALITGTGPGNDSKLGEDKIRAYRNFANKIWNATRFVLERTIDLEKEISKSDLSPTHKDYYNEWQEKKKEIEKDLDVYRIGQASEKIYDFFWHRFADVIIEEMKKEILEEKESKVSAQSLLLILLREQLIVMHPFIPFVTEEVWKYIKKEDDDLLIVTKW